jgi:hypothetical protein
MRVDATRTEDLGMLVNATLEKHGRLDTLILNAGARMSAKRRRRRRRRRRRKKKKMGKS